MLVVDMSTRTKNNASERDKGSRDRSPEILIEVYKHYQQLAINEDRLFNERLMVFLTSQSILFLGYITCFQALQDYYCTIKGIMIILPFVGILLCVFGFFLVNPARTAWDKWLGELKKIEKVLKANFEFPSEVEKEANFEFPFEARDVIEKSCFCSGKWPWMIGCYAIPLTFILLWVVSLVCSLHIFGYSSVCYVFVYN